LSGNLLCGLIDIAGLGSFSLMSVHSPAWPIDRGRLVGQNTSGIQLTQNRDVWVTDILFAALRERVPSANNSSIVAGDFNCSETFDSWKGGPRGNREYLDRMGALGLTECLRHSAGKLVPTYLNKDGKTLAHQIDHLFVGGDLARRLQGCRVVDAAKVIDHRLSDHLPIVAEFIF
jgi:exonuclease III